MGDGGTDAVGAPAPPDAGGWAVRDAAVVGAAVGTAQGLGFGHDMPVAGRGSCHSSRRPERRDQPPTPRAIALRSSVMNVLLSHAPRKVAGVVSAAAAPRVAWMAGLWQWPSAK